MYICVLCHHRVTFTAARWFGLHGLSIKVMLLSILVLDLQAILYGLLCSVTNLAILLFLMVCQTSTTTPISTPALTPKAVTPMLSLCAITKGRGSARDRGSARGLTKVPISMYGLLNSTDKKCCLYYICSGCDDSQRPPNDCILQHMQQEPRLHCYNGSWFLATAGTLQHLCQSVPPCTACRSLWELQT